MSNQYLFRRARRMAIGETIAFDVDPTVTTWANIVVSSGGSRPSPNTQRAMTIFLEDLNDASILHKMYTVNCYAPDSLKACITPLLWGSGYVPWLSSGFLDTDLTVNGLLSTSSKYLNTGVVPLSDFPSMGFYPNKAEGGTVYSFTDIPSTGTHGYMFGTGGAANSSQFAITATGGKLYGYCNRFVNYDQDFLTSSIDANTHGYFSLNRRSSTNFELFRANSTTGHYSADSGSGIAQSGDYIATYAIAVHAINVLGTPTGYTDMRLSFAAFHDGLSINESEKFYNAIQKMRINMGGGYR